MELGLRNHRVLVAGSSRGIGRGIAEGFLKEGAWVVITGRDKDRLLKTQKALTRRYGKKRVLAIVSDLSQQEDITRCQQILLDQWGHLDHLIVNMGTGVSSPAILSDPPQWDFIFDQNLNGPYKLVRAFLPFMQKRKKGNIVFIASIAGQEAIGAPLDYSCAKAALMAFSKNLSRKVAAHGIRVNTVVPGNIFFPGGRWEEILKNNPQQVKRMLDNNVPMKRFGRVEEITMPVLYLSSQQASFITGAFLNVDGGQTCATPG